MYATSYAIGLLFSVLVLKRNPCAARSTDGQRRRGEYDVQSLKVSNSQCRDTLTYCHSVKKNGGCDLPGYQGVCKLTCELCGLRTQLIRRENTECRDIGNAQFCQAVKPFCLQQKYQQRQRQHKLHYGRRYCRKTCGFCSRQQRSEKTKERTCVDRPICKKLTTFYKIENCRKLPHTLRRRAMKKCPKLCGLCSPITEKPQVRTTTRAEPVELETTEAPRLGQAHQNRPPHPPVNDGESDAEARSGVFYIYTKYLSL